MTAEERGRPATGTGPRRIGLLGGSFDPIHTGHLHAASAAIEAFRLDRVIFVPAAEPPHKPGRKLASGADRLAMVDLAIAGEPRFSSSAIELERGGRSYTIDTVRDLPGKIGERPDVDLYLILGSDNLPGLPTWREARALIERVQPIVIHRDGEPDAMLDAVRDQLGTQAESKLRAGYVHLPPVIVSSTDLRDALPLGIDREEVVPPRVLAYIREHGLYGVAPGRAG